MNESAEDDDISKGDALCDQEGACEQVSIEHLESGQQVWLCTLYILLIKYIKI